MVRWSGPVALRLIWFPHEPLSRDFVLQIDVEAMRDEQDLREHIREFGAEVLFPLRRGSPLVARLTGPREICLREFSDFLAELEDEPVVGSRDVVPLGVEG